MKDEFLYIKELDYHQSPLLYLYSIYTVYGLLSITTCASMSCILPFSHISVFLLPCCISTGISQMMTSKLQCRQSQWHVASIGMVGIRILSFTWIICGTGSHANKTNQLPNSILTPHMHSTELIDQWHFQPPDRYDKRHTANVVDKFSSFIYMIRGPMKTD